MLRAFALAALLALPLASAADVSFGLPAQADGGIGVGGAQWALLVFHGASGVFSLDLAAGTATNHTTLRVRGGSGRGA
ncbi:MAG: hypothetical protein QOI63_1920, partial [Thermoplasmata archaeon]|nr:hypothetical protein [Thermoplasmata archaeon]